MSTNSSDKKVTIDKLRWRLDPAALPFETTEDLNPLKEIVGQKRGVEAFRFAMGIEKQGYNVLVTGAPGTGRTSTVRKLLAEIAEKRKSYRMTFAISTTSRIRKRPFSCDSRRGKAKY